MPWIPVTQENAVAGAMVLLADNLLVADAASFDFTGIPSGYKNLVVMGVLRGTAVATTVACRMTFNNDSAANYNDRWVYAGASASVEIDSAQTSFYLLDAAAASANAGIASAIHFTVPNYAATTFFKAYEYGGGHSGQISSSAGQWSSTAALDRITIFPTSGNWLAGSRVTIYGLS